MDERVHPAPAPGPLAMVPAPELEAKPTMPKPGTYVIQVPKDQIYRVPSEDEARRFEEYTRRTTRSRRRCCSCSRCLCLSSAVLLLVITSLAAAAGVLYLVLRPQLPRYSLDRLSLRGFNLTSASPISPAVDATVRAENPNKKIGIRYRSGGSVAVSYSDVLLCDGAWPAFYQGSRNTTVFAAPMRGAGIRLAAGVQSAMAAEQRSGAVALRIDLNVPVGIKVGAVTSWSITVKVRCDVTVDKLTAESRILAKKCKTRLHF